MKKILMLILCLSIFSIVPHCTQNKNIHKKFLSVKNVNYSKFTDIEIVKRGAFEYVVYANNHYKIKRNELTKKISYVKNPLTIEEEDIILQKNEINFFEEKLRCFDKLDVAALSVDKKANVFLTIPWYNKCTYYFRRLSSISTLKELNEEYFDHYEDDWYMNVRCSE